MSLYWTTFMLISFPRTQQANPGLLFTIFNVLWMFFKIFFILDNHDFVHLITLNLHNLWWFYRIPKCDMITWSSFLQGGQENFVPELFERYRYQFGDRKPQYFIRRLRDKDPKVMKLIDTRKFEPREYVLRFIIYIIIHLYNIM